MGTFVGRRGRPWVGLLMVVAGLVMVAGAAGQTATATRHAAAKDTALPTWQSVYDWPNGDGYAGWHAASSSADDYGLESALGGNYGLWLWPKGGRHAYTQDDFAEWTYTAPGTTRLADTSLSFSYRNKLLAHHCIDVGYRTLGGDVLDQREFCQPVQPPNTQRLTTVQLTDAAANPTAKVLFVRIRVDCGGEATCARTIPQLDPLGSGAYVRVLHVESTLVDDDLPLVSVDGEFAQQTYIAGDRAYGLTVDSHDLGAGVDHAWVEQTFPSSSTLAGADAPCDPRHHTDALDARNCPELFSFDTSIDTSSLPEGRNEFVAKASDPAGNVGQSTPWSVLVDRTGPNPPDNIEITSYDAGTQTASVAWETQDVDPPLPTGEPGSGVAGVLYRYQVDGGDWSEWTNPDDGGGDTITPGFDVSNVSPGDTIGVEVRETDDVGNRGPIGGASLTITGDEQSVDDLPSEGMAPPDVNADVNIPRPDGAPIQAMPADDGEDDDLAHLDPGDVSASDGLLMTLALGSGGFGSPLTLGSATVLATGGPCDLGPESPIDNGGVGPVSWVEYPSCVVFTNAQASWTIYKGCHQEGSGSSRRGVGPGYIATVTDGGPSPLVDDFRQRNAGTDAGLYNVGNIGATNGGLGTFEVQYARGNPGHTPFGTRDPVTGASLTPPTSHPPDRIVSERMCAANQDGYGVYAESLHRPVVKGSTVRYEMEVWLKDPASHQTGTPGDDALFRIQHLYKFAATTVDAIHTVMIYSSADDPATKKPLVKEPKFSATLRADGRFTEMRVFSADGSSKSYVRGQAEAPGAVLYTRQSDSNSRLRVRWGCASTATNPVTGQPPCAPGSSESNPCVEGCFDVIMKSRAIPAHALGDPFLAATLLWENVPNSKATGLDGWARRSAARTKAYPRDTNGDGVITNCSAGSPRTRGANETVAHYQAYLSTLSEGASTGMQSARRWEIVGWKTGATAANGTFVIKNGRQVATGDHPNFTYDGSGVLFNGWEGARGPQDCEPLAVATAAATETYSTWARYYIEH